ncbi:MAG: hypothetical protein ACD_77C00103G0024 [uncultured bacterium]|nr:MAG: hypothetical protein ACD_77C00103G0024 [uncultured bacterium]
MGASIKKITGFFYPILLLILLFLSLISISKNLFVPYLWFDEAGQFFISKGLNHYSNPLSVENGIIQVIENNKLYNLDPGGFGILLHFWSGLSNNHIWLRLLPFIFFIGIVTSFIYLSYKWLKNINVAMFMGFIPILIPWVMSMGFEIRAYSMESLGTIICIIGLIKMKNDLSYKNLFLWTCVFSFFMTSRYSEVIVVFVTSIYVLFLIFKTNSTPKQKFFSIITYSIPLLATIIYIYFFAILYQNPNIKTISYLPYLSNDIKILVQPFNLLFLGVLFLLIISYLLKNRYTVVKKYEILLSVTIITNILFIILSFLGKHPWTVYSTRCISPFLLVMLCLSAFAGEYLKFLFTKKTFLINYINVSFLIFVPITIYFLYLSKEPLYTRYYNQNNPYVDIKKIDLINYNHIYVDWWESTSIRYLFEYGELKTKAKNIYPEKFTLEKYGSEQPKMNNLLDYDLIITSNLFQLGFNDKWKLIEDATFLYIQK